MAVGTTPKGNSLPAAIFHVAENAFFPNIAAGEVAAIRANLPVNRLSELLSLHEEHLIGKSLFCDEEVPFLLVRFPASFPIIAIPGEIGYFIQRFFLHPPQRLADPIDWFVEPNIASKIEEIIALSSIDCGQRTQSIVVDPIGIHSWIQRGVLAGAEIGSVQAKMRQHFICQFFRENKAGQYACINLRLRSEPDCLRILNVIDHQDFFIKGKTMIADLPFFEIVGVEQNGTPILLPARGSESDCRKCPLPEHSMGW